MMLGEHLNGNFESLEIYFLIDKDKTVQKHLVNGQKYEETNFYCLG